MDRRALLSMFALAAALLALAGCGADGVVDPSQPPDPFIPPNTPLNTVRHQLAAYAAEGLTFYLGDLTGDFRYHFSSQADPNLAAQYGDTWGPDDESEAANHLFQGFTNDQGTFLPGTVRIAADFTAAGVFDDASHPDSTSHYKRVNVPLLGLVFEFPDTPNVVIAFESNYDIYVVRGDAAVLRSDQAADSTRWYVRRIDDLAPALSASSRPVSMAAGLVTWGRIRAAYRH